MKYILKASAMPCFTFYWTAGEQECVPAFGHILRWEDGMAIVAIKNPDRWEAKIPAEHIFPGNDEGRRDRDEEVARHLKRCEIWEEWDRYEAALGTIVALSSPSGRLEALQALSTRSRGAAFDALGLPRKTWNLWKNDQEEFLEVFEAAYGAAWENVKPSGVALSAAKKLVKAYLPGIKRRDLESFVEQYMDEGEGDPLKFEQDYAKKVKRLLPFRP